MKRKTKILSAIALLGVLYAVPWLLALRNANVLMWNMGNPPRTPEAFAAQYPVLNVVVWLLRIDLFAAVASGWDPIEMFNEITHQCFRHFAISLMATWGCLVFLLHRRYVKRCSLALARTAQLLLAVLMVLCVGQTTYSFMLHKRVVPEWDRTRDLNILNNLDRFKGRNQDIEVPWNDQGVVLMKSEREDIHIEMDRRGWLSMSNCQLTRSQLTEIIDAKANRMPPPRFLLWMDKRSKLEDRNQIIGIATNISPHQTFFVIKEGSDFEMTTVYKGLNHNKRIDPYFKRPRTAL